MFLLRGLAVSFSAFFLVYAALSVAVAAGSKTFLALCSSWRSQRQLADCLFWVRLLPLTAAALITLLFVAPSFLLLEPRGENERLSIVPLVLGWAGLGLVLFGLRNAATAVARTARVVRAWRSGAQAVSCGVSVPVFVMDREVLPPCAIAGIVHPTVFISKAASAVLSGPEMQSVIRHEVIHRRRCDNLRKLLFRACAFPWMSRIENAWADVTEAAADDAAVSSAGEALDLAAALVKISRLIAVSPAKVGPQVELTMALVHPGKALPTRVQRLVGWSRPEPKSAGVQRATYVSALIGACTCVLFYGPILAGAHAATEWLVTQ